MDKNCFPRRLGRSKPLSSVLHMAQAFILQKLVCLAGSWLFFLLPDSQPYVQMPMVQSKLASGTLSPLELVSHEFSRSGVGLLGLQ